MTEGQTVTPSGRLRRTSSKVADPQFTLSFKAVRCVAWIIGLYVEITGALQGNTSDPGLVMAWRTKGG